MTKIANASRHSLSYVAEVNEMLPMAARLAGNMNTPEPIMLPATISAAAVNPILRFSVTCGTTFDILANPQSYMLAKRIKTNKQSWHSHSTRP